MSNETRAPELRNGRTGSRRTRRPAVFLLQLGLSWRNYPGAVVSPAEDPAMHAEQPLRQARAELERRLRAGEERPAEAVLAANPALAADAEVALELIYAEFALREALGQQPDPAGWCSRFPQWRERLHRLFQVDAALRLPP